jgi:hypothetical protein
MRQHPDPNPNGYEDEDMEELGTPIYEGSGLSVRALTARSSSGSWTPTPASPPSGWAAVGPPWTHRGTPWGVPGPLRSLPDPCRRSDPGRLPAAWAGLAAPPSRSTGATAPPSWPPGPTASPGGHRWSPPPA